MGHIVEFFTWYKNTFLKLFSEGLKSLFLKWGILWGFKCDKRHENMLTCIIWPWSSKFDLWLNNLSNFFTIIFGQLNNENIKANKWDKNCQKIGHKVGISRN